MLNLFNDYLDIDRFKESSEPVQLHLPSPIEGNNEVVHPSVYYNPSGWRTYKFWLAMTPYAKSNNEVENPSVLVSNDGKEWIVPKGGSNPIVEKPNEGHNSDPHIF